MYSGRKSAPSEAEYKIPEGIEIFDDLDSILGVLRAQIKNIFDKKSSVLIAIDGLPGSGKTTMIDAVENGYKSFQPLTVKMDNYVKTAPRTEDRERLHSSLEDFKKLYCDDESAKEHLQKLLEAERGEHINQGKIYSRKDRGFIKGGVISVPDTEKRLIIFEGTGAIQICQELREQLDELDVLNLFVHVDPALAIASKISRDERRGIPERSAFHKRDNELAALVRIMPTLHDLEITNGLLVFDNNFELEQRV